MNLLVITESLSRAQWREFTDSDWKYWAGASSGAKDEAPRITNVGMEDGTEITFILDTPAPRIMAIHGQDLVVKPYSQLTYTHLGPNGEDLGYGVILLQTLGVN